MLRWPVACARASPSVALTLAEAARPCRSSPLASMVRAWASMVTEPSERALSASCWKKRRVCGSSPRTKAAMPAQNRRRGSADCSAACRARRSRGTAPSMSASSQRAMPPRNAAGERVAGRSGCQFLGLAADLRFGGRVRCEHGCFAGLQEQFAGSGRVGGRDRAGGPGQAQVGVGRGGVRDLGQRLDVVDVGEDCGVGGEFARLTQQGHGWNGTSGQPGGLACGSEPPRPDIRIGGQGAGPA